MPTERDVYSGLFQASTEATEAGILTDELSELLEDLIAARDERLLGAYDDFMRSGNRRVLLKRCQLFRTALDSIISFCDRGCAPAFFSACMFHISVQASANGGNHARGLGTCAS